MGVRNGTLLLGVAAILGSSAIAAEPGSIAWKKTVVEGKFRSEGVATADVNRDGKPDLLIGDSWYEAPGWAKHDIRPPGDYGDGLRSYSECMTCWADDLNRDGWPDQIVIGFPGKAAAWYENPKGKDGHWTRHEIWPSACNETPLYTDLFGDGRRVLVMGWQPPGKDDAGQMAWFAPGSDPTQPWEPHAISEGAGAPGTQRFAHGLGVGDLNGDGRKDVICTGGWWEQPAKEALDKPWPFHPAQLGDAVADMLAYDVSGDGKADVIASSAHKYGIWAFEQGEAKDGHPTFTRRDLFPELVSETHALIAADIDRDGLDDLVTGKRFWSHGKSEPGSDKPAHLYWFRAAKGADGKIDFEPKLIDEQSGIGTQFEVKDFNGDGRLDVIAANKKGVFLIEQGPAGGTPESAAHAHPHGVRMGCGAMTFDTVRGWGLTAEGRSAIGPCHGGVAVGGDGTIYTSSHAGVFGFAPDGKVVRSFLGEPYVDLHDIKIRAEEGGEFLYGARNNNAEGIKFDAQTGKVALRLPFPKESSLDLKKFNPTAITVAPNGDIFLADGYASDHIFKFDKSGKYLMHFGEKGNGLKQFNTAHGMTLDTRYDPPRLLICDRNHEPKGRLLHYSLDGQFIEEVVTGLGMPTSAAVQGEHVSVPDLHGRLVILNGTNTIISVLGHNPDAAQGRNYNVPQAKWIEGIFSGTHGSSWDAQGNLYVQDWNVAGRIMKLVRVRQP
jgi:hypothetical protein